MSKKLIICICFCILASPLLYPNSKALANPNNTLGLIETSPYFFNETVHPFTNVQSYGNRGPYYSLFCYQPDITGYLVTVYGIAQYQVYPTDGSTVTFVLSGQSWTGGPASCNLSVWHVNAGFKNSTTDATFTFDVKS